MIFGVYVSYRPNKGKLVFRSNVLSEASQRARHETKWPWVWVRVVG